MPRYIRVNSLKQTFTEDLRIARSWKVIFLWIPKLLRQRMEFTSPMPLAVPFQDFVTTPESVSRNAAEKLADLLREAARLGFVPPVYLVIPTLSGESVTTAANCRHSAGEIVARLMHVQVGTVHPPRDRTAMSLLSRLEDGRLLVTTDQRATFNSPPYVIAQRRRGASLEELLMAHRKKLDELRPYALPEPVVNDAALGTFTDRVEEESVEFNIRRGLYEVVTADEIAAHSARVASGPAAPGADPTDTAVLAEIEKLHNRRGNWKAALIVALFSCAAFVAVGTVRWDWQFVLILTAVVVFHELGHYIAMRMLRYRDVRMFFIPLLGAAVTGRHYNAKGWQRGVVSLAGPVPGILLGLVLMTVALATHDRLAERIALVTLVLNGINLLPFIPLDGGWVVHAIVFSRHYLLETAFLGFAGLALIAATWLGHGRLWMYLGILVLIGLPAAHRLARLTRRLRDSGIPTASQDDQTVPPETALAILRELKQGQQAPRLMKHLASQTLDVFQKLNATPPGVLASVLLLLLYLGSGAAAFFGTGVIFASRSGLFAAELARLRPKPTRIVNPAELRIAGATNETAVDWFAPVVVATFTNSAEATSVFEGVEKQLASKDRLTLFGQSIFLGGGTVSSEWPARFKALGAAVVVEYPASNHTALVTLTCGAPDAQTATAIEREFAPSFSGLGFKTWPAWVDQPAWGPERKRVVQRARYTWALLYGIQRTATEDPETKRIFRRGVSLLERGKSDQYLKLAQEQSERRRLIYRRELDRLATATDAELDKELVTRYDLFLSATDDNRNDAWKGVEEFLIARLDSLPLDGDLPAVPQAWRALSSGNLERTGSELNFFYLAFYRTDFGLPALANYLDAKGCRHLRYEIQPIPEEDELPEKSSAR